MLNSSIIPIDLVDSVADSAALRAINRVKYQMEQNRDEIIPFADYLLQKFNNNLADKVAVEIGVRHGGTAALWCELGFKTVIGIDYGGIDSLGEKNTLELAVKMTCEYQAYELIYGDSHHIQTRNELLHILSGQQVHLLFLDGDHSYNGISKDFEMYQYIVHRNGIIAMHDIVDTDITRAANQGVNRFWDELKEKNIGTVKEFNANGPWGGIGTISRE